MQKFLFQGANISLSAFENLLIIKKKKVVTEVTRAVNSKIFKNNSNVSGNEVISNISYIPCLSEAFS